MVYQCDRRDKFPVFSEMAFECRSQISRPKPGFQFLAPLVKDALRGFIETKIRDRRKLISRRADGLGCQFVQLLESLPSCRAGLAQWVTIRVYPMRALV